MTASVLAQVNLLDFYCSMSQIDMIVFNFICYSRIKNIYEMEGILKILPEKNWEGDNWPHASAAAIALN